MKNKIYLLLFFLFTMQLLSAQSEYFMQYFDGADTSEYASILIDFDPDSSNVWQIGPPQKTLFNSSATIPNVLITDTMNTYPINNTSRFTYKIVDDIGWGIWAFQWKQKLDFDYEQDGGMVEFSLDNGSSWENAFASPNVYNFYGYNNDNVGTLPNGEQGFTGTDSLWRDIWLCYDLSFVDTLLVRHTMVSDSIDNAKEGWMIDNMQSHITFVHTVSTGNPLEDYLTVYPTLTTGRVFIEAKKINEFHIIESIDVFNSSGQLVQQIGKSPTKFYFDIDGHPNGIYFVTVRTNKDLKTVPILLSK